MRKQHGAGRRHDNMKINTLWGKLANAKAKANAATGIPELIEIAVGKHFRKNKEDKHKRDGKNGWYRYDSRFAIPVYGGDGEVERYNVFHASILIEWRVRTFSWTI